MFGSIIINGLLILSIITTILYYLSFKKENLLKTARSFYHVITLGMIVASAYLMYNVMTHNFSFTYIWRYSSTELPKFLLATTFYAGQEGSFALWALMLSVIGSLLIPYVKKHNYEAPVMTIYSLILVFIFLIMINKSPFEYIWDSFPDQNIEAGFMPANGNGLNPILQNYWNVIHPPILFLGFSAMSVPFAFAFAGLIKREYHNWIKVSMPWTLFATGLLSLGIMLGGFWAYETLGWGGFWGWDPVENASLIPLLTAIALVHTMLVQKKTGGLIRTNFVLAIISFVLVIYSTFLTRSGILGDSSVHSFGDPGKLTYTLLLAFLSFFTLIGIIALFARFKDISRVAGKLEFQMSSREFMLSLGSLVILAIAGFVLVGTSWPIIQEVLGQAKTGVQISIYDAGSLPLTAVGLILMVFSVFLNWKMTPAELLVKKMWLGVLLAAIFTNVFIFLGYNEFKHIALGFAAFFALFSNLEYLIKTARKYPKLIGAYLSHFGFALLILGVIASGGYSESQQMTLKVGQTKEFNGYTFKFVGKNQIEKEFKDREKFQYLVEVTHDGKTDVAKPIIYYSDFNQRQQPFLEPGILESFSSDIYLSPNVADYKYDIPIISLGKGDKIDVPLASGLAMTVTGFDMQSMMGGDTNNGTLPFGAIVEFSDSESTFVDTLYSNLDPQSFVGEPNWFTLEKYNTDISFVQFMPDMQDMGKSKVAFILKEAGNEMPAPVEYFSFEASVKPLINLVWAGTIAIVAGFFIAIGKYTKSKEAGNNLEDNSDKTKTDSNILEEKPYIANK